ncbi:uncharacterized protein ATNIH1004_003951 [Aspergillus tanneri]|uniref:NmrA-like domain-containing protein n=1 Tax=Aspergillus tanneri TaxID=1220188 RepID=A0A5M9MM20_9EURO|nr:uncharacterized protein ATNIH1004_003951 [Aspergillus tanneri]KAA8648068.1 hypothetical protein ATNIH1004_003951 [Aspergillus tanneri]
MNSAYGKTHEEPLWGLAKPLPRVVLAVRVSAGARVGCDSRQGDEHGRDNPGVLSPATASRGDGGMHQEMSDMDSRDRVSRSVEDEVNEDDNKPYGGQSEYFNRWSMPYPLEVMRATNSPCTGHGGWRSRWASTLPVGLAVDISTRPNGVLRHVEHFDSKAMVQEFIEANKGDMIASYFRPAMFLSFLPNLIRKRDGTPTMILPFPSDSISWPFIDPPQDGGKYVLGLFEGGSATYRVQVNAVSCWTTPKELASALTKDSGRNVALEIVDPETFAREFPRTLRRS